LSGIGDVALVVVDGLVFRESLLVRADFLPVGAMCEQSSVVELATPGEGTPGEALDWDMVGDVEPLGWV
jgi:hypothetical protein